MTKSTRARRFPFPCTPPSAALALAAAVWLSVAAPAARAGLLYPLDVSFLPVDFCGDGPTGADPADCPDQHNDDDSATIGLPFAFDFWGIPRPLVYVNNNGNITFGSYWSRFEPKPFPTSAFAMVAPFFGDVDTGNEVFQFGDVYHRLEADLLVVTWWRVGRWEEIGTERNTFQVALSTGARPEMGLGNNVCFSYEDLAWATALPGEPSTVGANRGNGTDAVVLGRFGELSEAWDGAGGAVDGVGFLEGRTFCFRTIPVAGNLPPVALDLPADRTTTIGCDGAGPLAETLTFLDPEASPATTAGVTDPDGAQSAGLVATPTPGATATLALDWAPDCADAGEYALTVTADDGAATTVRTLTIDVDASYLFRDGFERGDPLAWRARVED